MKYAIVTLGCKVNQFETQAMELLAREAGHEVVPSDEKADIYVVNSCAVTSNAGKKSRQEMRAARKRRDPVCQLTPNESSAWYRERDLILRTRVIV